MVLTIRLEVGKTYIACGIREPMRIDAIDVIKDPDSVHIRTGELVAVLSSQRVLEVAEDSVVIENLYRWREVTSVSN